MRKIDNGNPEDGWDLDVAEGVGLTDWFARVQYLSVRIQSSQRVGRFKTSEDVVEELEDIQNSLECIIPEIA
tara:strand:- start:19842 stop:20057 length:216 start_codon:yes stop_codon:yes gene_type:complete